MADPERTNGLEDEERAETRAGLSDEIGEVAAEGALPRHEYTGDPDSEDPKENESLAWDLAHAEQPVQKRLIQIKHNLSAAGVEELGNGISVSHLERHAGTLAEAAKREYFRARERLRQQEEEERRVREIGDKNFYNLSHETEQRALAVLTRTLESKSQDPVQLLWVDGTAGDGSFYADTDPFDIYYKGHYVDTEQLYELRDTLYKMIGAEPPSSDEFQYTGKNFPPEGLKERFLDRLDGGDKRVRWGLKAEVTTPGNMGYSILEKRDAWLAPEGQVYRSKSGVADRTLVRYFGLWIVPSGGEETPAQEQAAA